MIEHDQWNGRTNEKTNEPPSCTHAQTTSSTWIEIATAAAAAAAALGNLHSTVQLYRWCTPIVAGK
jgi:hypothetical protein